MWTIGLIGVIPPDEMDGIVYKTIDHPMSYAQKIPAAERESSIDMFTPAHPPKTVSATAMSQICAGLSGARGVRYLVKGLEELVELWPRENSLGTMGC